MGNQYYDDAEFVANMSEELTATIHEITNMQYKIQLKLHRNHLKTLKQ